MAIKAVGTITANLDDGKHVRVDWSPVSSPREWYFYTNRATVWRVAPGGWMEDGLLAFAIDGQPQDLDRFRNEPFWRERFGDAGGEQRFRWTTFYSAVAAKLLDYRADRRPLIEGIHAIAQDIAGLGYLQDRYPEGGTGPLRDICPFTTMGTFNRSMTDANRRAIAGALARLIGVEEDPFYVKRPVSEGRMALPTPFETKRKKAPIGALGRIQHLSVAEGAGLKSNLLHQRKPPTAHGSMTGVSACQFSRENLP